MSECLTQEQLGRLLSEQMAGDELDRAVPHIEECLSCCRALERLSKADAPAALITPALEPAHGRDEPDPTFLERIKQHNPSRQKSSDLFVLRHSPRKQMRASRQAGHDLSAELPDIPGYEVLEILGQGGMGVVYRARQLSPKRIVAIKFQHADQLSSPESRQRFLREAEAVARLQHPNIVEIYEFGEHQGKPFLALEYLPDSLSAHVADTLPANGEAAKLVESLGRAMHCAHEQGVVHRDLKPGNVLLTAAGAPKITDFGLMKQMADDSSHALAERNGLTETGQILGTPSYMAPEQARGSNKSVGPAADIWALGAILYELLTGRPPFQGENPLEILQQVIRHEPVPPSRLRSKLPRDLEVICLKCLEKDPGLRYRSCAALADDLGRFQRDEPIHAKPTPLWRRGVKWAKRRPAWAAMLTVSIIATAALLGFWLKFTADLQNLTAQLKTKSEHASKMADLAAAETSKAENSLIEARKSALRYLVLVRDDEDLQKTGLEPLRRKLLEEAIGLNDKLLGRHANLPSLQMDRAEAYHVMGNLLWRLSTTDKARAYFVKAIRAGDQAVRSKPNDPQFRRSLGTIFVDYSRSLYSKGRFKEAEKAIRQGIQHLTAAMSLTNATDGNSHFLLGTALTHLGRSLRNQDDLDGAEAAYLEAKSAIAKALKQREIPDYFFYSSTIDHNLHVVHEKRGDYQKAEQLGLQAVALREKLVCQSQGYPQYIEGYANSLRNMARFYEHQERSAEAEHYYTRALAVMAFLVEHHPKVRFWRTKYGNCHQSLGNFYRNNKQPNQALQAYIDGAEVWRQAVKSNPGDWSMVSDYCACLFAAVDCAQKEHAPALIPELRRAKEVLQPWIARNHEQALQELQNLSRANSHVQQLLGKTTSKN